MKKELKEYIKSNKLSDDDILKLLTSKPAESGGEDVDIKDEKESEDSADSKEQSQVEVKNTTDSSTQLEMDKLADLILKKLEEKQKTSAKKSVPAPKPSTFKPNEWGLRTQ